MIFISGLINIENTLKIDGFPLDYYPITYPFFGIHSSVSGVAINLRLALERLDHKVEIAAIIGKDPMGLLVTEFFRENKLDPCLLIPQMDETAQSIILYDKNGRRQIHVDLKNIQDLTLAPAVYSKQLIKSDLAMLCNINYSRPMLKIARDNNIPIATDLHVLSDTNDEYNKDFMEAADILFLSNEDITGREQDFAAELVEYYRPEILVIGMGTQGALLYVSQDNSFEVVPAVHTRPVINTIGAGDALFASFNSYYLQTRDPRLSIRKAIVFASYKIGEKGASAGFLDQNELDSWYHKVYKSQV